MDYTAKTIIITGASRGIGAATARHLAGLGAHVVLAARSGDEIEALAAEIEATGGTALARVCDVSNAAEVEALIAAALGLSGRLDMLVNNAGLIEPIARLAESDPAAWGMGIDVNLKGVYHGIRFALPPMLAQGGGTIVNISSGAATSPIEGWSQYCAGKAAVLMLTRMLDTEYRAQAIRAIGLSPGTVATDMQVKIRASGINPVSQLDPSVHIAPDWVARAIAWLGTAAAEAHLGADVSLRSPDIRAAIGLPLS